MKGKLHSGCTDNESYETCETADSITMTGIPAPSSQFISITVKRYRIERTRYRTYNLAQNYCITIIWKHVQRQQAPSSLAVVLSSHILRDNPAQCTVCRLKLNASNVCLNFSGGGPADIVTVSNSMCQYLQ